MIFIMRNEDRDRGNYNFQRWNGYEWEEWTGNFPDEQTARLWYEDPNCGGYFRFVEGRHLGLFYYNHQIHPEWMNPNSQMSS